MLLRYCIVRISIAVHSDRSLRQHLTFGPDAHAGFDAIWMAVSDLGYVDRQLWDNAGTVEGGPWASITKQSGDRVWRARYAQINTFERRLGCPSTYSIVTCVLPSGRR